MSQVMIERDALLQDLEQAKNLVGQPGRELHVRELIQGVMDTVRESPQIPMMAAFGRYDNPIDSNDPVELPENDCN